MLPLAERCLKDTCHALLELKSDSINPSYKCILSRLLIIDQLLMSLPVCGELWEWMFTLRFHGISSMSCSIHSSLLYLLGPVFSTLVLPMTIAEHTALVRVLAPESSKL